MDDVLRGVPGGGGGVYHGGLGAGDVSKHPSGGKRWGGGSSKEIGLDDGGVVLSFTFLPPKRAFVLLL